MFELMDDHDEESTIKVLGVGGAGCNALEHMISMGLHDVEYIATHTDYQALNNSRAKTRLHIGKNAIKGSVEGSFPKVGRKAAEENIELIKEHISGSDILFVILGLGGGTGTGASPIIAKLAKEMGILTVAIVSMPLPFESKIRRDYADTGIKELNKHVDSIITVPNDAVLNGLPIPPPQVEAFKKIDDYISNIVIGISESLTRPGLINIYLSDIRTLMSDMGKAAASIGAAKGEDRAELATEAAIESPFISKSQLEKSRGLIASITAGPDFAIDEFETVGNFIKSVVSENTTVVVGTTIDMEMTEELKVTIIATGIGKAMLRNVIYEPDEITNKKKSYDSEQSDDYLDIPAFLRKPKSDKPNHPNPISSENVVTQEIPTELNIIAPDYVDENELADLISHISNLYKANGGDELIIENINSSPPDKLSTVRHKRVVGE